jgi:hypothetical protein
MDQRPIPPYRDRAFVLRAIGALLILGGLGAAWMGPLEVHCFSLFSEGGRFAYPGFRFGSFMFGYIAVQVIGYYVIAAIALPIGWGHLRLRRWARPAALALLWLWAAAGVPLVGVVLFIFVSSKDPSLLAAGAALLAGAAAYLMLPALAIPFYRGENVRRTLAARDPAPPYAVEGRPVPVLVLCALYLFFLISLHVLLLFNGFFPLFGELASGLRGMTVIDGAILLLAGIAWGTWRMRRWAWWGGALYLGAMAVTWLYTLARSTWPEILAAMAFPPYEVGLLDGMPVHGAHFAVLVGLPLLAAGIVLVRARRHMPGVAPSSL